MGTALQLSEATSIALHGLVLIAHTQGQGEYVPVKEIAAAMSYPQTHLSKVFRRLVRAKLLSSYRGPTGGFRLARPADQITLLDVFESIEGRLFPDTCPISGPSNKCPFGSCVLGDVSRRLTRQLRDYFDETTIADVAKQSSMDV